MLCCIDMMGPKNLIGFFLYMPLSCEKGSQKNFFWWLFNFHQIPFFIFVLHYSFSLFLGLQISEKFLPLSSFLINQKGCYFVHLGIIS